MDYNFWTEIRVAESKKKWRNCLGLGYARCAGTIYSDESVRLCSTCRDQNERIEYGTPEQRNTKRDGYKKADMRGKHERKIKRPFDRA